MSVQCTSSTALRLSLAFNLVLLLTGLLRHGLSHYCSSGRASFLIATLDVRQSSGTEDCPSCVPPTSQSYDKLIEYNSSVPSSEFLVPNIVHYIWYNTEPVHFQFHHMLCMLSASKLLQPDLIYFHTNIEPVGPYWQRVKQLPGFKVRLFLFINRVPLTTLCVTIVHQL